VEIGGYAVVTLRALSNLAGTVAILALAIMFAVIGGR
jgi:hypothetical protein